MSETSACERLDLASYLDGELGPEAIELVEAHLLGCAACRAVVASWHLPEAEPRTGLAPGARFDQYTLVAPLGAGGMGAVFRAHDESLGRDVAVKVLNPFWVLRSGKTREAAVHELRAEARTLARLRHPNIVTVYGVSEVDGRPYLAMEWVQGPTLRQWHERAPSRGQIAEVWAAIARGLMAAHAAGIVHRDFKPDNVIVDADGQPRLLDFGLAAPVSSDEPSPAAGTLRYAAPEQLAGGSVDARADQFSFCTALHEVVFGHHPSDPPKRPRLTFPSRLRASILRGLEPDPERRHSTMQPLVDALDAAATRGRRVVTMSALALGIALFAVAPWGRSPCPEDGGRLDEPASLPREQAAWITQWNSTHRRACLDTRVRGAVGVDTYRARLSCLEDLASQFEAQVLDGAWSVSELSAPTLCMRSDGPTDTDDPQLLARLDAVRTLHDRLDFVAVERDGQTLARDARHSDHPRIAASALKFVAAAQLWRGEVDEAEATLRRAQELARLARADVLEARLWTSRAELEGLHREQPGVALGMLEVAESLLERANAASSVHTVHLLHIRGMIHAEYLHRDEAAAALEHAVGLAEQLGGPTSTLLPQLLATLGGAWAYPGEGQDLERAQSLLEDALRLVDAEDNDGFDDVARIRVLNQLAAVEHQQGRFEAAAERMERVLRLPAIADDPLDTALLEANLAVSLAAIPERAVDAERLARETIATFSARRGAHTHLLLTPRLALAHALIQQQRCTEALAVLDRAVSELPFDPTNQDRIRAGELAAMCDGE